METSVSVPSWKSAIVAPGESIDSSGLPNFHKTLVARGLCPCVTRYGMETSVSVSSQNPGGCPCVIRYGMETSVSVPLGKSAIVAPGESIDSSASLPAVFKCCVDR